jgi:hypothetical protein
MQFQQSILNKHLKTKNMATSKLRNSIHASFQRCALLLVSLLLTCFALPQKTQAVVPAPNGGYSGFNTAEGTNALQSLTTGVGNAAVGWYSLFSNTDGSFNTAVGAGTLLFNTRDHSTGDGTQTQRSAQRCFYSIPRAHKTPPTEQPRCSIMVR